MTSISYISNEFLGEPMLEDFNFDGLFLDFVDRDVLPDLEVDLVDFSFDGEEEFRAPDHETTAVGDLSSADNGKVEETELGQDKEEVVSSDNGTVKDSKKVEETMVLGQDKEEVVSSDNGTVKDSTGNSPSPKADKEGKKSSMAKANAKGSNGKRKMKVDWTPELHRRFVQAVEQLGIDKAVPSRILEIIGFDCLTRHNVASHLQKYRSHRRHLLAREAEAASWSHQRHMTYATAAAAGGPNPKREQMSSSWVAPTMGFPSPPPPPLAVQMHRHFRSCWHVWGHPTMDMWPKYFAPGSAPAPPPPWLPPPPHPTPWLPHYPKGPNAVAQGTACFPRPVQLTMRFPPPAVACVPPHPLYRPDPAVHPNNKKLGSQLQLLDPPPSKESIDAVLGDVLAKPWLPLPLGLKPPSPDNVLMELQKQGISKVPPTSS